MLTATLQFARNGNLIGILNGGLSDREAETIWRALGQLMTRHHDRAVLRAARQGLTVRPQAEYEQTAAGVQ